MNEKDFLLTCIFQFRRIIVKMRKEFFCRDADGL